MAITLVASHIRPRGVHRVDPNLVHPPTDDEKYWYLGRSLRWLVPVQAVSFGLVAWSIAKFAVSTPLLLIFLVPMTLYAVCMVVSLLSGAHGRNITRRDHDQRVRDWRPAHHPSVDVFLPSAGEPLELLANTFTHVERLEWPGELRVLVLDDSARVAVRDLADEYGFEYHSRPNRGELKKAGNLRYGYENSRGDHIVVLDADFVPRRDFLTELVPYFDESDVGIVQSPQFFDTRVRRMRWLQRCAGATQELFYRVIQPSRDKVNAAICVGTCAIYRRAALARAGGFAQIGHSEDVHTGVKLMKSGFRVKYVPVLVSKGLCPDEVGPFLSQQYRWCSGSMALLADRSFHESRYISKRQRLCFWAGFLYYISTAVNAVVAPLPAIAMLWGYPQWVEPMNSIWLVGALLLWFVILPMAMRGKWRFGVLRVQYLYSFAHLAAITHLLRGRTREWVATGASTGKTRSLAATIARPVRLYTLLSQVLIWTGLVRGVMTYGLHQYWAMVILAVVATYIHVPLMFIRVGGRVPLRERARGGIDRLRRAPARTADTVAAIWRRKPEAAAPGPRRWRPDIQGLRAIAVTLVVLYHAQVPGITGGYVGVDVFFVISGFLITGQLVRSALQTGRVSLISFWGGRIRRLLPQAAIVVACTVLAARVWDSIFHIRSVGTDALYTLVYAMNYRLAAEGVDYQQADGPPSPLQHMWSLSVEEQFYVLWPLLLLVCALVARKHLRIPFALLVMGVLAGSFWFSYRLTETNPPLAYFALHTRAWELALGALLALAAGWLARMPAVLTVVLSWLGVAGIVYAGVTYTDATPFPGTAALLPTLATVVVIAAGCRTATLSAESVLLARPVMQGIGKVSYGWYLWHWPLVVLVPLAVGRELNWLLLVEISLLALWFAVLSHWLVERPAQFSRSRMEAWVAGGAVMSATVAALAAAVMLTVPGFVGGGAAAQAVELDKTDRSSVQKALISGMSVQDAPRNLKPRLVKAAAAQPKSSKDGCHANYLNVNQPDCVYGDPDGQHTLALIGDSHAQQWLPALDAEAKRKNWKLVSWTKAACPIANFTVTNDALGRDYTECDKWRKRTVNRVLDLDPDIVVGSQSDTVPGTQVTNTEWADYTTQTIRKFQTRGIPMAYILDTPYPDQSVPDCIATHLDNVGACHVSRDKSELWAGRMATLDATLKQQNVTALDPTNLFCTSRACPAVVGNLLVYRDGSHMTSTYSRWLAPMTAPLFQGRST